MNAVDLFKLDGRLAVVTGASRGLGAGLAIALAQAGADIVGISRTMPEDGGDVGNAVRSTGREFIGLHADLAERSDIARLVAELDASCRPVDILVNNAGLVRRRPAEAHTDDDWDQVLAVDLTAPFLLSRELGARMVRRNTGKIVFVASMMAFQGGNGVVSYSAAKSGLAGVVRALANEWACHGVGVNAIAPGYIETELTLGPDGDPARIAALTPRIPRGRWARPEDFAGAVIFLSSPASDYVNGVILPVDGGWLVR